MSEAVVFNNRGFNEWYVWITAILSSDSDMYGPKERERGNAKGRVLHY
jgi:hypothetical protein